MNLLEAFHDKNGGPTVLAEFQRKFVELKSEPAKDLNAEEEALIEKIYNAFQGVTLEDGIGLMQAEAEDYYACQEVQDYLALHEERDDWTKFTDRHLNTCSCALSYVDPKGFRFLIPAFVIHDTSESN